MSHSKNPEELIQRKKSADLYFRQIKRYNFKQTQAGLLEVS